MVEEKFTAVWQGDREYHGTVFISVICTTKDPQTTHLDEGYDQHGSCEDEQGRNSNEQSKCRFYLYGIIIVKKNNVMFNVNQIYDNL